MSESVKYFGSYPEISKLEVSSKSLPGSLNKTPRNFEFQNSAQRSGISRAQLNRANSFQFDRKIENTFSHQSSTENIGKFSPYLPRENPSHLLNTQIRQRIQESINRKLSAPEHLSSPDDISLHYQIQKSISKKLDQIINLPDDEILDQ